MKKFSTILLLCTLLFSAHAQSPADTIPAKRDASLTGRVVSWYNSHLNYGTVTLLMAVESSFIPFPSEVIVPPAAYQACNSDNPALYKTDSKIVNVIFVILFATLGALIGALINYFLSMILGRIGGVADKAIIAGFSSSIFVSIMCWCCHYCKYSDFLTDEEKRNK